MPVVILGFGVPCVHKEAYLKQLAAGKGMHYRSLTRYLAIVKEDELNLKIGMNKANLYLRAGVLQLVARSEGVVVDFTMSRSADRRNFTNRLREVGATRIMGINFTTWCADLSASDSVYEALVNRRRRNMIHTQLMAALPQMSQGFDVVQSVCLAH